MLGVALPRLRPFLVNLVDFSLILLDKTSQWSYHVVILSNRVPDNCVYRFPAFSFPPNSLVKTLKDTGFLTFEGWASEHVLSDRNGQSRELKNPRTQKIGEIQAFLRLSGNFSQIFPFFACAPLDDGQITHLIRVRLKVLLHDSSWGSSGFPVFPSPFLSSLQKLHMFLDIPRAVSTENQEDVNGEKLTVKKWWIFGADFFTVWCRFFHGLRRFFTVYKGHKR